MKKCKLIHINDGVHTTITNSSGYRRLLEEFPWAEETIDKYINQGYEVKQIIPDSTIQTNSDKLGIFVYLEKEEN